MSVSNEIEFGPTHTHITLAQFLGQVYNFLEIYMYGFMGIRDYNRMISAYPSNAHKDQPCDLCMNLKHVHIKKNFSLTRSLALKRLKLQEVLPQRNITARTFYSPKE